MDHEHFSTVYSWFEKCGIISNIRTHLRQNLINALKNKDPILKSEGPKCAKQYVYDLLIAEYLFNHNYAYTLSVFASEAPLLINFHNKKPQQANGSDKENKEKLQGDYILHTLETLGMNPYDSKGQYVISQYIESDMPLLLCILKCVSLFSFNAQSSTVMRDEKPVCDGSTQTRFSWQSCQSDIEKLHTLKKKVLQYKQDVNTKLLDREMMLKEQAVLIEEQLETLNKKLEQVQSVMQSITKKEKQLREEKLNNEQQMLQKETELTLREKLLLQETERLHREQNHCRKFEEDLRKLQDELVKVRKELPQQEELSTINLKNMEVQTDFENDILKKDKVEVLTREKEELTNLVQEQKLRIEQITQRALQLSRQVDEMRFLRPTSFEMPTQTVNVNTVISESSSTEDILQDAKLRLRRLEEESLKADQYYYNFINASP